MQKLTAAPLFNMLPQTSAQQFFAHNKTNENAEKLGLFGL